VVAFTNYLVVVYDHGSDERIGVRKTFGLCS